MSGAPAQAVILCGGLGTRIAALSGGLPKSLLPIAGRPFLDHLLLNLVRQGVRDGVFLVGHGAEAVVAAARQGAPAGLTLRFSHESAPLGTGGALKQAEPHLAPRFLMLNGDTFLRADLGALAAAHDRSAAEGAVATLALVRHREAGEKGAVETAPDQRITRFLEKGRTGPGWINAGVYVIERSGVADIPGGVVSLERDVFPRWMARADGRGLCGWPTEAYFVDIGLPEDYLGVRDGFPDEQD